MDKDNSQSTPATDDQELAKVLASMNQQATTAVPPVPTTDSGLSFEETPMPSIVPAPQPDDTPAEPVPEALAPIEEPKTEEILAAAEPTPSVEPPVLSPEPVAEAPSTAPSTHPELDSIKKDALAELRPLIDHLELPADEKFDTLLLIIRSTDDQSLLSTAYDAAKAIDDETKRAQALLDVIKEIDFFSQQS